MSPKVAMLGSESRWECLRRAITVSATPRGPQNLIQGGHGSFRKEMWESAVEGNRSVTRMKGCS